MMGVNHLTSGVVASLLVVDVAAWSGHAMSPAQSVGTVAAVGVGSLLPDIDSRRSLISQSVPPVTWALSWIVRSLFGHRGASHSALFAFGAGLGGSALTSGAFGPSWWWLGALVGVGCLVHLVGDAGTIQGISLWWPFVGADERWWMTPKFMRFRVNGWVEWRLISPALIAAGVGAGVWLAYLTGPVWAPLTPAPAAVVSR